MTYYGYDFTWETNGLFDVAFEPSCGIHGRHEVYESPFDVYRAGRFRSAALYGLYDAYDLYSDR
jgi:hypothetical protein